MSLRLVLPAVAGVILASLPAVAQQKTFPATPLASKHFSYPTGVPYQADTEPTLIRGSQYGYNMCNSTTEGQESLCQTSFFNSIDDFCLWGPPEKDSVVGDTEGETVAWCTKPGRGTRLIPAGALKGLQFIKTPAYIQLAGFIDQSLINIKAGDYGGELDPHGADLRGNPLGGLMYSTAWSGNNDTYQQVIEWTNFIGSDSFCFKACDPAGANAADFCEHIYDRIGCTFNMPNQARNETFEACKGENQDYPGIYTENGAVMTYTQPGEGIEPNPTYTPKMPASSECVTYISSELFAALPTPTGAAPTGSPSGSGSGSSPSGGSGTRTSGGANPTQSEEGAAMRLSISAFSIAAIMFSVVFLS
jgi:hypothetical protein